MSTDIEQLVAEAHSIGNWDIHERGREGEGPTLFARLVYALEREHERAEALRLTCGFLRVERDAAVQRAERAEAAIREALEWGENVLSMDDALTLRRILSAALDTEKGDGS